MIDYGQVNMEQNLKGIEDKRKKKKDKEWLRWEMPLVLSTGHVDKLKF